MNEQQILRALRKAVRRRVDGPLNLRSLADRCGVSIGCLSETFSGKATPKLRTIVAVCNALDIPWAELAGDDNHE